MTPPQIEPLSGLLEGGTMVTISGSNLGQKSEDILHSVSVAGVPCTVIPSLYEVSSRYRPTAARVGDGCRGEVHTFCVFISMFLKESDGTFYRLSIFLKTKQYKTYGSIHCQGACQTLFY